MRIEKTSLRGSPFIGVLGAVTEKIALLPRNTTRKEVKMVEDVLGVQVIKTSIASSDLIGALVKGNKKGFVVGEIIEEKELNELEDFGVKVKVVKGFNALGNLIALNDFGGIISPLINGKALKEIEKFFKVKFVKTSIANSEVSGASIAVSNKGFIVNPNVNKKEFKLIEKVFKVKGQASTANYGDVFVGNDVLANSKGVLVGNQTSGFELIRIDEGFRG
jgi:translation initiation factor 6